MSVVYGSYWVEKELDKEDEFFCFFLHFLDM